MYTLLLWRFIITHYRWAIAAAAANRSNSYNGQYKNLTDLNEI